MMTKKHFIALADYLRGADLSADIMYRLCKFMYSQNPRFMEYRWRDYLAGRCGPNGGKVKYNPDGSIKIKIYD